MLRLFIWNGMTFCLHQSFWTLTGLDKVAGHFGAWTGQAASHVLLWAWAKHKKAVAPGQAHSSPLSNQAITTIRLNNGLGHFTHTVFPCIKISCLLAGLLHLSRWDSANLRTEENFTPPLGFNSPTDLILQFRICCAQHHSTCLVRHDICKCLEGLLIWTEKEGKIKFFGFPGRDFYFQLLPMVGAAMLLRCCKI